MLRIACACVIAAAGAAHADETPLPKLGPDAVSLTDDNAYLRQSPAPDYWAFAPFVKPQFTTSACSVAAVTAAVNGLRGLPALAEEPVMSQEGLLEAVGDAQWASLSAEGGDGVTFAQLEQFSRAALLATGLESARSDSFRPTDDSAGSLATLRAILTENEASADDVALVYFNQGVVTGDWDGPHVAVIGAYDAGLDRVLVLEVDQEWYVPYWTPAPVLLAAMLRPTSDAHGPLEGETGGLVRIWR
ncbi:phytochelatin synthase family protein [Pararhodobacter sp.]|uniref:phytochelatin synthase family protein n=1 Tax=Pararhodobacter sp. TaxID=2127056 RepID=UPI002FDD5BF0